MERLPEFIANHLFLVTAFVGVAGILAWTFISDKIQGVSQAPPGESVRLINHENALVVDVRESAEYDQGYIINSLHIPLGNVANSISTLDKYREQPIVVTCHTGHRSAQACRLLKQNGFEKVYNMRGGVSAWQNAGLPLTKGKKLKRK